MSGVDAKTANLYVTVHRMMKSLYHYKQGQKEQCDEYSKDLDLPVKTVPLGCGNPLYKSLYDLQLKKLTKARDAKIEDATKDEIAAA